MLIKTTFPKHHFLCVWLTLPKTLPFIIAELQTMNNGVTSPETISKLFTSKAKTSLRDSSYFKSAAVQHAQLHNDRVVMRPFLPHGLWFTDTDSSAQQAAILKSMCVKKREGKPEGQSARERCGRERP